MGNDISDLIARAQKGDKDAYGEIYKIFVKRIYRFINFLVWDRQLAEDFTQETFFKGWKSITSFQEKKGASFQAFLFAIARNLVIDWQRKKKDLPIYEGMDFVSEEDSESDIRRSEEQKMVWDALYELEFKERHIVVLRYFEELSFCEIAKVVGVREGALRVRVHRSIAKLKKILEDKQNGN